MKSVFGFFLPAYQNHSSNECSDPAYIIRPKHAAFGRWRHKQRAFHPLGLTTLHNIRLFGNDVTFFFCFWISREEASAIDLATCLFKSIGKVTLRQNNNLWCAITKHPNNIRSFWHRSNGFIIFALCSVIMQTELFTWCDPTNYSMHYTFNASLRTAFVEKQCVLPMYAYWAMQTRAILLSSICNRFVLKCFLSKPFFWQWTPTFSVQEGFNNRYLGDRTGSAIDYFYLVSACQCPVHNLLASRGFPCTTTSDPSIETLPQCDSRARSRLAQQQNA